MKLSKNPRIVLAGSVNSTLQTFKKLIEHKCNLVAVLGLHPKNSKNVSGYLDLKKHADVHNIPFKYFRKINDTEITAFLNDIRVDLFFVIGLSQMIREPLLSMAEYGNVGFHPTKLPEGRGRGVIAWMILGKANGAATFFLLDEGMDSGPILGQSEFEIKDFDYANDIIEKIKVNINKVLDVVLPKLKSGELVLLEQNHQKATYLGQRKPRDGMINWNQKAEDIHRLIRATSRPLPGAFTLVNGKKLIIYKASVEKESYFIGISGRVIQLKEKLPLITCGEGALWIEDYNYEDIIDFKIGLDI